MAEDPSEGTESLVGRRRLLRSGLNLGVSGALVFGLGADYVSREDLGTITYALARPSPGADALEPRTRDVPVAWHESLRLAFAARERLVDAALSPLVEAFVVPGSYADPAAVLSVGTRDGGIRETIERLAGDVATDLEVVEAIPSPPAEARTNEPYQISRLGPEGVPGGVVCESADGHRGTLAPALFDAETGERRFATSNHVYGRSGTKVADHRGARLGVVHEDATYRVGEVLRGYPGADLVVAEPLGVYPPAARIERADPSRVVGQYTRFGLADLAARDEPLTKVGAMTGATSGHVEGVAGVTCYTGEVCKRGQLKWGDEHTLADGDSGSVSFHVDEEHPEESVLVGGVNNARSWWPGADYTWGPSAHHLLEEYGHHF